MSKLTVVANGLGWSSIAIGALQTLGGSHTEAGMDHVGATVDSHVRFMGPMFMGYGVGWLDAAQRNDTSRMELLGGLMGLGGCSRLITRATMGRPHRFHDVLMALELSAPLVVELLLRGRRAAVTASVSAAPRTFSTSQRAGDGPLSRDGRRCQTRHSEGRQPPRGRTWTPTT